MLDVRRLVLLRDLAAHGTVTAVAELHGVTPSAVSQQLRLLEEETRARLLEAWPLHPPHRPPDAGWPRTPRVCSPLSNKPGAVCTPPRDPAGPSILPASPALLCRWRPRLGDAVEKAHPVLSLHITEAEPEHACYGCSPSAASISPWSTATPTSRHLRTPASRPASADRSAGRRPANDHPAVRPGGSPIDLRELADTPWITAPAQTACGDAVLQACRSAGFMPEVRHTCTDFSAMIALAASGGHPVLIPRMATAHLPPALTVRPVTDDTLARTIEIAVRHGTAHEPVITVCLDMLRDLGSSGAADGVGAP